MTQWLAKSYTGLLLCKPCWNNQHNHRVEIFKPCKAHRGDPVLCKDECPNGKWIKGSQVIVDCEQMGCQCPCVQLLNEKHPQVKPDYSQQMTIMDVAGEKEHGHDDRN